MTVRVVVADDQQLVRAGLHRLLELDGGITVVGEAEDGPGALDIVRRERPDVALLDIRMPHLDGIEVTRRLAADPTTAAVRVVVLTTFDIDEYIFAALRAGAGGFLSKTVGREELCRAVHVVAAGDALLSPDVTRRVIAEFGRRPESAPDGAPHQLNALTDRELEVLRLVATGASNEEIGSTLRMSPLTAKTHVSRILAKLAARDRAQLVMLAYETGLVRPGGNRTDPGRDGR